MALKEFVSKFVHARPVPDADSVLLNVLGYHTLRTLFFRSWQSIRPFTSEVGPENVKYLSALKRDGIVVIPDFFPPETFAAIRDSFATLEDVFAEDPAEVDLPHVDRISVHHPRVPSAVREAFTKNETIRTVVEAYLRCHYHFPLQADITRIYMSEKEIGQPLNGGTNNLHFDAPLRVVKAFYYVTETNAENGAFTYCYGSNKRSSLRRLLLEYKLSIRFSRNRGNPDHGGEYLTDMPWVKVTPEEMRRCGLVETPVTGKANTLILVDTGGFHRRGMFKKAGMRQTVEINYRSIETIRNLLLPLEKRVLRYARNAPHATPKHA